MKVYDSKNKKINDLSNKEEIQMYVCGPTVYNHIHIGNLRPLVVFDMFNRTLVASGKKVNYVHNFTDIDDKIIDTARALNKTEKQISEEYIAGYNKVINQMNVLKPSHQPKVTENLDGIIKYIMIILEKGMAYEVNGNVYFRTTRLPAYGSVSNKNIKDLITGSRVEEDKNKEEPTDFVLWKNTSIGVTWDSPWGKGRPGWHTECAHFIDKYNNGHVDIHGGGIDLKFPHHENENAQACVVNGCASLSDAWVHNGHLQIDGQKMSKSLGNFILARDVIREHGANVSRLALLSSPYTQPINFSELIVKDSKKLNDKILRTIKDLRIKYALYDEAANIEENNEYYNLVLESLKDNLNTSNAFMHLNNMIKEINKSISQKNDIHIALYKPFLKTIYNLFGLQYILKPIDGFMLQTYRDWLKAKQERDFNTADVLRLQLTSMEML